MTSNAGIQYIDGDRILLSVTGDNSNIVIKATCQIIAGNSNTDYCFKGVANILTSFSFESNPQLNTIKPFAFYNLQKLTQADFSSCTMLRSIGDSAFQGCKYLSSLILHEGLLSIGANAFWGDALTLFNLPSTVTKIGDNGFLGNPLQSFTIPSESQLTNINFRLFGESKFTSLFIPFNCSVFFGSALYMNNKINSITVDPRNTNFVVDSGCVFNPQKTILYYRFSSLTSPFVVPDGVQKLGNGCFMSSLSTSITVSNTVTSVDNYAFYKCVASTIILPDSIQWMGYASLKETTGLESIRLPNNLTSIPDEFMRASAIKSIIIPENVTSIGSYAFSLCINLVNISLPAKLEILGGSVKDDSPKAVFIFGDDSNIYINNELLLMDKANTYIAQYFGANAQTVSIPETVKKIRINSFKGKTSLVSITCPSTSQLEIIESYAFYGCIKLSTIFPFPAIKSIYKYAFYRCSLSQGIQFGQNLNSIGEFCFSEVSNLQSVEFTSRVSLTIENNAFSLCPKIAKILFNNEMSVSIGDYCFMGLPSVSELFIPSTVTSAGSYCFSSCGMNKVTFESNIFTPGNLPVGIFSNCTSLSDFSIPDNVNSLGSQCLEMTSIKNVNIPDSVVDLGSQCFKRCNILSTVNITNTSRLTNIGYGVFEGCSKFSRIIPFRSQNFVVDYGAIYTASLDKMIIYPPASPSNFFAFAYSVKSIAESAFIGCINLEIVLIPDSTVRSIGASAFSGCINLRTINIPLCVETIGVDAFFNCPRLSCGIIVQNKTSSFRNQLLLSGLPIRALRDCDIKTCAIRVQPNNLIFFVGVIIIM